MSNADPRGRFVWHELLTSDAAGAAAFYPKVVPWKPQAWERDPTYTLWVVDGAPVGGVATLTDPSATSRWVAYVGVDNVADTIARATELGAKVLTDATEIPDVGTYAILADPQGAEFAIYKSASDGRTRPTGPGSFGWHELCTSDPEAALRFYSELFGWTEGPKHEMGDPVGVYHIFQHEGVDYGGIYRMPDMPPAWTPYVVVTDAGKATSVAKEAGARVLHGPTEVPGGSWISQLLDPAGVAFAVLEPPAAAKKSSAAKKSRAQKASVTEFAETSAGADGGAEESAPETPAPKKKRRAAPAAEETSQAPSAEEAAAEEVPESAPARRKASSRGKAGARKSAAARKTPTKKRAGKKAGKKASARKTAKKSAAGARRKAGGKRAASKAGARAAAGRPAARKKTARKSARKTSGRVSAAAKRGAKKGRRAAKTGARGKGRRRR